MKITKLLLEEEPAHSNFFTLKIAMDIRLDQLDYLNNLLSPYAGPYRVDFINDKRELAAFSEMKKLYYSHPNVLNLFTKNSNGLYYYDGPLTKYDLGIIKTIFIHGQNLINFRRKDEETLEGGVSYFLPDSLTVRAALLELAKVVNNNDHLSSYFDDASYIQAIDLIKIFFQQGDVI